MSSMRNNSEQYAIRLTTTPRWYRCEPGWRWQPPPLTDYDLWCVASGAGLLQYGGNSWDAGAHDCFIIPPGTRLLGTQDPENRLVVFAVHFVWLDANGEVASAPPYTFPPGNFIVRDWGHLEAMSQAAERCYMRGDDLGRVQATAWVRQMLLHLIAEAVLPPSTPVDAAIADIIAMVRREPGQWYTVEELAEQTHLSTSQFTRRFRAVTGMSPRHFLIYTRLERARQLLLETEMTLEHIASALGYRDLFFFARQYRQLMGETPGSTRRTAQQKREVLELEIERREKAG